jgi:hypothetical protein
MTTEPNHLPLAPEVKRLEYETIHSLLPTAEVKNMWSFASTPLYTFLVWCLGTGTTLTFYHSSQLQNQNMLQHQEQLQNSTFYTCFIFQVTLKKEVLPYMGGKSSTGRIHQKNRYIKNI